MPADGQSDRAVPAAPSAPESALAHALVLEAVDCLSGASALVDDGRSRALRRHTEELTALAEQLSAAAG